MQKKKSIENRIVKSTSFIAFTAIIVTSIVAGAGMFIIRNETLKVNANMGAQAAEGSREALEKIMSEEVTVVARNKTLSLNQLIEKYNSDLDYIEGFVGNINDNPDSYKGMEYKQISDADGISPIARVMYAPGADAEALAEETALYANIGGLLMSVANSDEVVADAYFGSESGILLMASSKQRNEMIDDYDHRTRNWYTLAKQSGEFVASEVYPDAFGRGEIISFSKPVYNNKGEFIGVVGINILTSEFKKLIEADETVSCQFLIISDDEDIIIANDYWYSKQGIVIENFESSGSAREKEIREDITGKDYGTMVISLEGRQIYLAHTVVEKCGWILITYVELDESIAPAKVINDNIIGLSVKSAEEVSRYIYFIIMINLLLTCVVFLVTTIVARKLSKRITKPIKLLTENAKQVSMGNFHVDCDIKTKDEIQDLSDAFRVMTHEMESYIEKVKVNSFEKEKRRTEMDIAQKIQLSILPTDFVDFSQEMEFEVSATIRAAKGVGGDFYDYFMIDETHLAIVIADVSGKGVPAAMFMMISKTLINSYAKTKSSTAEIFTDINEKLCINNDAGMFVTAFMGILDIKTGEFEYSNAGHTPPLLYRYKKGFEWLPVTKNLFLAGMEDTKYVSDKITLSGGDLIFLYTDGVTEAADKSKKQFSKERLFKLMSSYSAEHMTLDEIMMNVTDEIVDYSMGVEQTDDITMLIMRYFGNN